MIGQFVSSAGSPPRDLRSELILFLILSLQYALLQIKRVTRIFLGGGFWDGNVMSLFAYLLVECRASGMMPTWPVYYGTRTPEDVARRGEGQGATIKITAKGAAAAVGDIYHIPPVSRRKPLSDPPPPTPKGLPGYAPDPNAPPPSSRLRACDSVDRIQHRHECLG